MEYVNNTLVRMVLFSVALVGCAPKVTTRLTSTYPPLEYTQEVVVVAEHAAMPVNATQIGTVKVGDSGFSTNCDWDIVIEKARTEVRKAGGNVLKIIEHTPPNFGSSCHRIEALILKVDDPGAMAQLADNDTEVIDSTWNHAVIYAYRPGGVGALVGYDLHLGDSLLCRMKTNSHYRITVTKMGLNTLWAKTEALEEIPIDIEIGREYYVRCSMTMGVMVGRPRLEIMAREAGKAEFDAIKKRKE